jgi:multiple sugar transport system ATP-binding protein
VRGSVHVGDAHTFTLRIGEQDLVLDGAAADRLSGLRNYDGRDIAVGIRSEALGGDGTATVSVSVDLVEMLGSELLVHSTVKAPAVRSTDSGVEISDSDESTIVSSLDPRRRVHVEDRLELTVDTMRLHAFDLETGDAIGRS